MNKLALANCASKGHNGEGVNMMKYAKPEIVVLVAAADAIQSGDKNSPIHMEVDGRPTLTSAYEADE